jgi:hypothetical protein
MECTGETLPLPSTCSGAEDIQILERRCYFKSACFIGRHSNFRQHYLANTVSCTLENKEYLQSYQLI